MLVLSRKTGQAIQIGENVTVTVLKVKGNTIRIGISAPSDVRVVRGELIELEIEASEDPSSAGLQYPSGNLVAVGKGEVLPAVAQESVVRDAVVAFNSTPSKGVQFSIEGKQNGTGDRVSPLGSRVKGEVAKGEVAKVRASNACDNQDADSQNDQPKYLPVNRIADGNYEAKATYQVQQYRFKTESPVNEKLGS